MKCLHCTEEIKPGENLIPVSTLGWEGVESKGYIHARHIRTDSPLVKDTGNAAG